VASFRIKALRRVPRPGADAGAHAGEWRLLTTLPDLPSAHALADALGQAGVPARVSSDAGVLGQAAPSRIYVSRQEFARATEYLAQGARAAAEADPEGTPP